MEVDVSMCARAFLPKYLGPGAVFAGMAFNLVALDSDVVVGRRGRTRLVLHRFILGRGLRLIGHDITSSFSKSLLLSHLDRDFCFYLVGTRFIFTLTAFAVEFETAAAHVFYHVGKGEIVAVLSYQGGEDLRHGRVELPAAELALEWLDIVSVFQGEVVVILDPRFVRCHG